MVAAVMMAAFDQSLGCRVVVLVAITSLLVASNARPHSSSRQKRVSDQRLAELETLIGLSRMKGKLVTVPVGYGLIDPAKLGKRKRSAVHNSGGPWWEREASRHGDIWGPEQSGRNHAKYFSPLSEDASDVGDASSGADQYDSFPNSHVLQVLSDYTDGSDDYRTQMTL